MCGAWDGQTERKEKCQTNFLHYCVLLGIVVVVGLVIVYMYISMYIYGCVYVHEFQR